LSCKGRSQDELTKAPIAAWCEDERVFLLDLPFPRPTCKPCPSVALSSLADPVHSHPYEETKARGFIVKEEESDRSSNVDQPRRKRKNETRRPSLQRRCSATNPLRSVLRPVVSPKHPKHSVHFPHMIKICRETSLSLRTIKNK